MSIRPCPRCNGTMELCLLQKWRCFSCGCEISFEESENPTKPFKNKEEPTMQVSYNGFTGELVKMERHTVVCCAAHYIYDISIYESEKQVTHSFTGVKLEDVKFLGGAVSFCG